MFRSAMTTAATRPTKNDAKTGLEKQMLAHFVERTINATPTSIPMTYISATRCASGVYSSSIVRPINAASTIEAFRF